MVAESAVVGQRRGDDETDLDAVDGALDQLELTHVKRSSAVGPAQAAVLDRADNLGQLTDQLIQQTWAPPAVLVNAEDAAVRANRYALLAKLRGLFLGVADISVLG